MVREFFAIIAAAWLASQATAPPDTRLHAGSAVERRLAAGEYHSYAIELTTGDFLHVVVEQRGLDVAVRLVDPEAVTLFNADSRNGPLGFERVAFIAPRAGVYRIEIRTSAAAPSGSYNLEVRALRPATGTDQRHEAAERAHIAAETLRRTNTAEGRVQAVVKYDEAAQGFEALGLEYEYALTVFSRGLLHLESGDTRAAVRDLTAVLPLVQQRFNQLLPSVVNALGGGYDILGDLERAMASYRQALTFYVRQGERAGEAAALGNIGKLFADRADWQQALDYYRQSLTLRRELGDVRREALVLYNIGVTYGYLGDSDQAIDDLSQALEKYTAARDKAGEADALSAMGVIEAERGNMSRALESYDRALPLRRDVGDRRSEGITLNDIGRAYLATGQHDRAREFFEQALERLRGGADRRNVAMSLGNLANAHAALSHHTEAIDVARQALAIFREIADRQNTAGMLYVIARLEREFGALADARRDAADALAVIEGIRGGLAGAGLRTSYFARQHDVSLFYIDLLMRQHDREPAAGFDRQALEASERARARTLLDSVMSSGAQIAKGADPALLDRERRVGLEMSAKADRLMRFAARSPAPPEAIALDREIRALQTEYDDVRAALRRASPVYSALTQPRPLDAAAIQHTLLDDGTALLQYALGPDASYLWVVDRERINSYRLPTEATIVAAVRDVHARVTGPRDSANRIALRAAIARLSAMVLPSAAVPAIGARLAIVPDGALEYVPFAMLTVRPAGAGTALPLIERAEIVTLPSASALASQRIQLAGRPRAPNGIAVLADPVFDRKDARASKASISSVPEAPGTPGRDDARILAHLAPLPGGTIGSIPRLPFTQREATSIIRAGGTATHLEAIGFDATKELVLNGSLRDYRYVHFATHGYVDAERPALSAIVLSLLDRDGKPRDGFLRAHELYNLDLAADLVVLSACETGLGRQVRGEGIVGLTRGFMYAGAARVVVSLWSVSDRATAALMSAFYDEMLVAGKSPAAALRAAQRAMRKQPAWEHPYYWAGFVIAGDWQ